MTKAHPRRHFVAAAIALLGAMTPALALAQDPPAKPIHLVVPFTAGASSDVVARSIAPRLSEMLGRSVIVDNRPGAGGTLAADLVAKGPADGSMILIGGSSVNTVTPNVYRNLPYDAARDLAAVTLLTKEAFVLVAHPSLPADTVAELTALARSKPGQYTIASYGNGTLSHLAGELCASTAGIQLQHVPYKGSPQAMTDLLGGQVSLLVTTASSVHAQIAAGKLKALAVLSAARVDSLPSVPTLAESGVAVEVIGWIGAFVPAATPRAVTARLNEALVRINQMPDIQQARAAAGAEAVSSTPEELTAIVNRDLATWARVIKSIGGLRID